MEDGIIKDHEMPLGSKFEDIATALADILKARVTRDKYGRTSIKTKFGPKPTNKIAQTIVAVSFQYYKQALKRLQAKGELDLNQLSVHDIIKEVDPNYKPPKKIIK